MKFTSELIPGTMVKRYKRFFADVALEDGTVVTSHCPNTGSMRGVSTPGSRVYVSPSNNPARKLKYTLELIRVGRAWVGVNTGRANGIAAEAIAAGSVAELAGYPTLKREVKYGKNSRIDILLEGPDGLCYVEVKNTTLAEDGIARFPDAVTTRGQKHLEELVSMIRAGHRGVMLYLVHRSDCTKFCPADDIDPDYGKLLRRAADKGLEILPYACRVGPKSVTLTKKLPYILT